jgi:uncharacterized repeat protein (TIGR01451 family)
MRITTDLRGKKNRLFLLVIICLVFISSAPASGISSPFIDCRTATVTVVSDNPLARQDKGRFTAGDGAGRIILYGYPAAPWSSFTTVNINIDALVNTVMVYGSAAGSWQVNPYDTFDEFGNSMNTSTWAYQGIHITQDLSIIKNPDTNANYDTIMVRYAVENNNTFTAQVGLRIMLDTQANGNDASPVYTSSGGLVSQEEKFSGAAVPDFWYTQDNPVSPVVTAKGYLSSAGATVPDMLIIGQWDYMNEGVNIWDYAVHAQPITDSAVAAFYNPVVIPTLTTNTITAYFGIADFSGANLAISKSANVAGANYGDTISYAITYLDNSAYGLTGLSIWDTLPWNAAFLDASPGYVLSGGVLSWSLPDLSNSSNAYSLWVRVIASTQGESVTNTAYGAYIDSRWNTRQLRHSNEAAVSLPSFTPTQTYTSSPTFTITPTLTITQTPTISPTFTPTPPALVFKLEGNFPNPAVIYSNFVFTLTRNAAVVVRIYTISGEFIIQKQGNFNTGRNSLRWDLKNLNGADVASGTYLYKMSVTDDSGENAGEAGKFAVVR